MGDVGETGGVALPGFSLSVIYAASRERAGELGMHTARAE